MAFNAPGAREQLVTRLKVGSALIRRTIEFFQDEHFIQLLPVMLGRSTDPLGPDPGSSIMKTPEVDYLGTRLYTMNSMILHKQCAVRDLDRIFILSPNIRLERAERQATGKHLFEFTQLDFEWALARQEDVMRLVERYFLSLNGHASDFLPLLEELGVPGFEFRPPFRVYTTHDLESQFGTDWEFAASQAHEQPFWALCHRREFYDREDPSDPGHFLNYDLIYPEGFGEALSGAEREFDLGRLRTRMGRDKLDNEAYRAYLSEAAEGFVPSAGAGFGIERLVRFLTRAPHVGDVQLFKRVPGIEVSI